MNGVYQLPGLFPPLAGGKRQFLFHCREFAMIKKTTIRLPENPKMLTRMKKKVKEYQHRLARLKKTKSFANPIQADSTITAYKAVIARRLTQQGEVDIYALSQELREEYGYLDFDAFNNAAGVIEDYCETGGKHVTKNRQAEL